MRPENLILRRRLAHIESHPEPESISSRRSRSKEERRRRLTEEKNAIQKSLDSIVYPILTIPFEITAEIFVNCLPDRPISPSGTIAPMLLTGICSQWRKIACSTPTLWAALQVDLDRVRPQFRLLVSEWLRRARAGLSCLHLTLPYSRYSDLSLKTLPFGAHWVHLTSFRGVALVSSQCLDLLSRAPQLACLELDSVTPADRIPLPSATKFLLGRLQHLELDVHYGHQFNTPLCPIFDSLTAPALQSLEIGVDRNLTATSLCAFLERAPTLQSLGMTWRVPSESDRIVTNTLAAMCNLTALRLNADPILIFGMVSRSS
ncbi:hypothetical protein C8R46DRAFT_1319788 [Mycena filopes]|nr:hypothetical protein C8R46DRAFT_1319788 [Mycena filopes]